MKYTELAIPGAFVLEPDLVQDERGFFARLWCREELRSMGLEADVSQISFSFNHQRGTLRGLHYQKYPYEETKLVRCSRGELFDVVVDLREDSPTFRKWISLKLTESNHRILYIPKGCLHGFQTLVDATEIIYQMSESYRPGEQTGIRWNDPTLAIEWPIPSPIVSSRDMSLPRLE
jgi:dTDP-4-dehydrorhamnose 3,5-epimerase